MFKDRYKRDMEKVTPSPESVVKTKEKMLEACAKKPRRFPVKQLVAAATCLFLVSGTILFAVFSRTPNSINDNRQGNPHVTRPGIEDEALSSEAKLKHEEKYEDIFAKIKPVAKQNYYYDGDLIVIPDLQEGDIPNGGGKEGGGTNEPPAVSTAPSTEAPKDNNDTGTKKDYSDTNNQVDGVQEADIIKTDGKYIYASRNTSYPVYYYDRLRTSSNASKGKVDILSTDNGKISLVSSIAFRSEYNNTYYYLREIFLHENTLVLIKEGFQYPATDTSDSNSNTIKSNAYYLNRITSVEIYDITDRKNPVFKNELYQSGTYSSSRMIGANLYIITNYTVYSPDEENPKTYIPFCSSYDEEYLIPANSIFVPDTVSSAQYNIITGIDVNNPDNHKSSIATLGFMGTIYASKENIYIASYVSGYPRNIKIDSTASNVDMDSKSTEAVTDFTNIYRFSINKGVINLAASGKIKGRLLNQFAMDEYKDAFRVAVTVNEYTVSYAKTYNELVPSIKKQSRYNELYILNMNLNLTGSVTNMAPNESIQSVRFDGEIGYVVTFRQVDPLFAIDLSDVTSPKVLSALKIPGFSTYMHTYGEGLLFGIGMDADDNGRTNGLKLSMFDVIDKTNVTEIAVYKLGMYSYYSEALYNHKAILVDHTKNIIGFPVSEFNVLYNTHSSYKMFKYENNEFKEAASFPLSTKADYNNLRGLYIGNYLYVFAQNQFINSYDLNSLQQTDSYKFN